MFKKRIKPEVVPVNEYTDYSDRFEGDEKYATLKHVAIAAAIPSTVAVGKDYLYSTNSMTHIPPQLCL